jgi:hypothetical protein
VRYPTLLACMLFLFPLSPLAADLNPEKLSTFRLEKTRILAGFVRSNPRSFRRDYLSDKPTEATATLNERLFHGSSEITYSVMHFSSDRAFQEWDQRMRRSAPGWVSPLGQPLQGGVRESRMGGVVRSKVERPRALLVGPYLIRVAAYQHPEMIRRNPGRRIDSLSDADLSDRMRQVAKELLRRVKAATKEAA